MLVVCSIPPLLAERPDGLDGQASSQIDQGGPGQRHTVVVMATGPVIGGAQLTMFRGKAAGLAGSRSSMLVRVTVAGGLDGLTIAGMRLSYRKSKIPTLGRAMAMVPFSGGKFWASAATFSE